MKVDISLGELVDKVSILAIKIEKIKDPEKLYNVVKEYKLLHKSMLSAEISDKAGEYVDLFNINKKLWEIEDLIRAKEAAKQLGLGFDEE